MKTKLQNYAMALMLGMGLVGVSTAAHAEEDISVFADIGVFSNYIWRGAAQGLDAAGKETPSLQGDIGVEHSSGVSASLWFATGVNGAAGVGKETEFDVTVDYSGEAGDIGYSVGVISYNYTDSALNFNEIYVGGSFSVASLTAYYDPKNKNLYAELGAGATIADMFDLSGAVGRVVPKTGSGANTFTVGASKDFDMDFATVTPSLTVGKYDTADTEFALGVNASF